MSTDTPVSSTPSSPFIDHQALLYDARQLAGDARAALAVLSQNLAELSVKLDHLNRVSQHNSITKMLLDKPLPLRGRVIPEWGAFVGQLRHRTRGALTSAGLCAVDDVVRKGATELSKLKGIGPAAIGDIQRGLAQFQLRLTP